MFKDGEAAFEALIKRYQAAVYGTLYAYLRYDTELEDLAQETFVYAYFHYEQLRDREKEGAWLCGIARNMALKYLRGLRYAVPLEDLAERASGSVEDWYVRREQQLEIRRSVENLSKPVAETVMLFYFSGRSIREIAQLLSVSEGTIKSRLHEGRKKLKGELIAMIQEDRREFRGDSMVDKAQAFVKMAEQSLEKRNFSAAAQQYTQAIDSLEQESNNYRMLAELYRRRAHAITFTDRTSTLDDGEKSIACAKLSGDARVLAESLTAYAFDCERKKGEGIFREAYAVAETTGYFEICCESAFWTAASLLAEGALVEGEKWLTRSLDTYERGKIGTDATMHICDGDAVRVRALARAAQKSIALLEEAGRLPDNYSSLNAFCQILHLNEDSVISANNYGWDIPGAQCTKNGYIRGHFGFLETRKVLFDCRWEREDATVYEYYTYGGILVNRKYEVLSRSETISVRAGTFTDCMHIRATDMIPQYDDTDEKLKTTLRDLPERECWLSPGVGIVREITCYPHLPAGKIPTTRVDLMSYMITEGSTEFRYFPLNEGSRWEYEYYNLDDGDKPFSAQYVYRDCYEVDLISDSYGYLSNYGYLYQK